MINCGKCGKDNQDHYKFCLGCGGELSRADGPKPFSADTPPHGVNAPSTTERPLGHEAPSPTAAPAVEVASPEPATPEPATPVPAAPAPTAATPDIDCPQCGHRNADASRFCASCGYNLSALSSQSQPAMAAAAPADGVVPIQLTALRADGSEAGSYRLPNDPRILVGRDTGDIFAGDSYLSPKHASLTRHGNGLIVRDEGSLNGVYLKIQPDAPWPLAMGDVFRIGQEIIRVEPLEALPPTADGVERLGSPTEGLVCRLALVIGRDTTGNAFPVPRAGVHCGRERGDILFSEDGYVSGLHCKIAPDESGQLYLTDVGSSNGTFVRLSREQQIGAGDIMLMGQQLFRVDM